MIKQQKRREPKRLGSTSTEEKTVLFCSTLFCFVVVFTYPYPTIRATIQLLHAKSLTLSLPQCTFNFAQLYFFLTQIPLHGTRISTISISFFYPTEWHQIPFTFPNLPRDTWSNTQSRQGNNNRIGIFFFYAWYYSIKVLLYLSTNKIKVYYIFIFIFTTVFLYFFYISSSNGLSSVL